ncbi:chlorite dismutase family protein [Nitrospira sp. MA-1]|nr:chlorite dismutase family protein [Nitrospira sp. MA-1]
MPVLLSLVFITVVHFGLSGFSWAADAPVFGTFALYEVDKDWKDLPMEERQKGGEEANQQLLTQLRSTGLGRHLDLEYTISGVTKELNYAPDFPDLLQQLKGAKYEGDPSTYAIMIPIRKNAEWWNLSKEDRVALMKEHTIPTVAYLKSVKRKLYHSTGISDVDFLTIFETNNLVDFNDLVIALRMVREDIFNVQLGEPTIIGTLKSWNDIVDLLVK